MAVTNLNNPTERKPGTAPLERGKFNIKYLTELYPDKVGEISQDRRGTVVQLEARGHAFGFEGRIIFTKRSMYQLAIQEEVSKLTVAQIVQLVANRTGRKLPIYNSKDKQRVIQDALDILNNHNN